MEHSGETFRLLQVEAQDNPDVVGFFLGGSRGKGRARSSSDYDVYVIVKEARLRPYVEYLRKEFPSHEKYSWVENGAEKLKVKDFGDIVVFTLSEFELHAAIGTEYEWNRYNFAHVKVLIDKNGLIQGLVDEKGVLPEEEVHDQVSRNLGAYLTSVLRSLKCVRDEDVVGARLEASRSIHYLLEVLFGIEGRITPYYKYLDWELAQYPLERLEMQGEEFIACLMRILDDADVKTQQRLLQAVEQECRMEGYATILEDWEPDLKWIRTYEPLKRS